MTRIVLLDDHELVLQGIYTELKEVKDFEIVGAYSDVQEFLLCLKCNKVDLVLMDLMLGEVHGFDVIEKINALYKSDIKIVLISGFYDEILHRRALDIGVKAFLRKEVSFDELISTMVSVANGNVILPVDIHKKTNTSMFTDMELAIIKLIVNENTNENIANNLFISRRTVENHISAICSKMGVTSRLGIVREAVKINIV